MDNSLYINGEISETFISHCGVRQGDPLSPYIYILVAQILTQLLNQATRNRSLTPLSFNYDCKIIHIMFVGDILLCFRANPKSCTTIKRVIKIYEEITNKKISHSKSAIYFPKSTPRST